MHPHGVSARALGLAVLATISSCGTPRGRDAATAHSIHEAPYSILVTHARVHDAPPDVEDVAIRGSRIAALGKRGELACADGCVAVDAQGAFLGPGFHDAHTHLAAAGRQGDELHTPGSSLPRIQAAVRKRAADRPGDPWILGQGWSVQGFLRLPTRLDLDLAEPDRPVALRDHTGHNLWINSAALAAAGVTKDTPDPPGGTVVRDANGDPTGILLDAAQGLVTSKEPPVTEADRERHVLAGEAMALHVGCTSMQGGPLSLDYARTFARLDREGRLRQRAFLWGPLLARDPDFRAWIAFARTLPKEGRVHVVAFKGFADGTFAARTAALLAP